MALSRAQIQVAFQNSLGRAASASDENSYFSVSQSGALTDAQIFATISNSREADQIADPVIRFYQAAFGRVPDQAGLQNAENYVRANGPSASTYQMLSNMFAQSQEFTNRFGTGTAVDAAYVQALYSTILGRQASSGEVDGYVNSAGITRGSALYLVSQSQEAISVSNNAVNGFQLNAAQGQAVYTGSIYTAANGQPNTPGTDGQTLTLTTGVDNLVGGNGNDTITGVVVVGGTANTYTAGDSVNGGAGTDTFNIIVDQTNGTNAGVTVPVAGTTISGVEVISINSTGNNAGDTITANVAGIAGVTTVNATLNGTAAPVTLTSNANATAMSVSGATQAIISDANATAGGDRLATVSLTGVTGTAALGTTQSTIASDALTNLNLTTSTGDVTVTAAAGTRALNVGLNGVTGGIVTDATATTLNVASTGAATTGVTLAAAAATAINISSAVATTLADVQASAATTITATGAGATTISALTTPTALTTINASGSTGGLSVTPAIGTGVLFTGGTGADAVSLTSGFTRAITTGAGNDTVTYGGVAGTGGSVVAGEGIDTIVMTSALAATASGSAVFNSTFSGFETLRLSTITNTNAVNLAGINGVNSVESSVGVTGGEAVTINGYSSGGTLTLLADVTGIGTYNANVTNAAVTAGDVFNIGLRSTTALATSDVVAVAGVETVNILSPDAVTTATGSAAVVHALTLQDAAATTVNVSGNNGLTLTSTGNTAVTRFDASGVVGNGTADSADNLAVTYTSANTTATAQVTIIGGAGNDALTGNAAIDTINGGAGNDAINGGAGSDFLTGGLGVDTFAFAGGQSGGVFGQFDTVTDFVVGTDKLRFTAADVVSVEQATVQTNVTALGAGATDAQVFQNMALTSATNNGVSFAVYNGNTYVLYEAVGASAGDAAADAAIKLTGVTTLPTFAGDVVA